MSTKATPIYLPYRLRLRSPAIVSTLSGDPNTAITQPFIPGGTVRGAMAARLLAEGVNGDGNEFRSLILSGEVRYLHAYPELGGERALPTPLSWRNRKDDQESAFDLAAYSGIIEVDDDPEDFDWPQEALKSVTAPFSAATGSARTVTRPRINSRLHQQRDRVKGRPWTKRDGSREERLGLIFPFEYLEADQTFRGVIQIMPSATVHIGRIKELLDGKAVLIGRSRRAGYGGEAMIEFTGRASREYENAPSTINKDIAAGERFRIMLTSAYIGRHPATGQIDPGALDHELWERLGGVVKVERRRWAFEAVGAFNQKWRLEVPQAQAITARTVLVLTAENAIPIETIRTVEHEGVGERRTEGFGRVLFLQHSDDRETFSLKYEDAVRTVELKASHAPTPEDQKLLDLVERRIVLAAAKAELDQIAAVDFARKASGIPRTSLLGRIRTLFRAVTDEETAEKALGRLAIWCGDGDDALKQNSRDQLEKCKIGTGSNLMEWLKILSTAKSCDMGWRKLKEAVGDSVDRLNPIAQNHHLTNKYAAQTHLCQHAAELCVYLIDSVLAALARRNRMKSRGDV